MKYTAITNILHFINEATTSQMYTSIGILKLITGKCIHSQKRDFIVYNDILEKPTPYPLPILKEDHQNINFPKLMLIYINAMFKV
jgi:hypothetical protein